MAEGKTDTDWLDRNPDIAAQAKREIQEKIEKNSSAGKAAFASGEFNVWKGYDYLKSKETMEWKYRYTPESLKEISDRVIEPLQKLAQKHGIIFDFAGKEEQPAHTTLDAAVFDNVTEKEREVINSWLKSGDSHMNMLGDTLKGHSFELDTLIVGPATYICDSKFGPKEAVIYRARLATEKIWSRFQSGLEKAGLKSEGRLKPLYAKYTDIFQVTCAKVIEKAPVENLIAFMEEANKTIGKDLKENPIKVTVQTVEFGQSSELQFRDAPKAQILNRP